MPPTTQAVVMMIGDSGNAVDDVDVTTISDDDNDREINLTAADDGEEDRRNISCHTLHY